MNNPEKSVALVTGAATGIGRATALAFADAGCDLVIADLDETRLEILAQELEQRGCDVVSQTLDVTDQQAVNALHAEAKFTFGRLDYACNNAGIEGLQAPTAETTLENFDRVMNINVRGLLICMQAQLAMMLEQDAGSIVNVASVAGLIGFPGLPSYCASKGAVIQLTKASAVEYADQNIRVNAVCPGPIKTEMIDRITGEDPETVDAFEHLQPMNRMGTAQEVADTIVWLAMGQASYITGQALAVDGGMVAR